MLKKITGSILTIMLMTTMFLGAFSVAAPEPVHAAAYTFTVTADAFRYSSSTQGYLEGCTVGSQSISCHTNSSYTFTFQVDSAPTSMKFRASDGAYGKTITVSSDVVTNGVKKKSETVDTYYVEYSSTLTANHTHTWNNNSYLASGNVITATCQGSGTCDLTKPQLTLNATGKTYDGSVVTASLTKSSTWSSQGLPTPTITYNPANSKNAGTYTASAQVGNATATKQFTISPKEVGLSWGTNTFTYDGSSHAPSATATNLVGGDSCNVTVGGAETAAGSYTATATGLSNSNYKLPNAKTKGFTINPKEITVTGLTAKNRVYDGTATADLDVTQAKLEGVLDADKDKVQIDQITGVYTDGKNVGEDKAIDVTVTLKGEAAGNYDVEEVTGLKSDITKRPITVSKIKSDGKVFDNTTAATSTLDYEEAELAGKKDGEGEYCDDKLGVTAIGTFRDAAAGPDKTIDLTDLTLTGSEAGNYKLAETGQQETTTGTIGHYAVTVTAKPQTKEYGTADPELTYTHGEIAQDDYLEGALSRHKGEDVGQYEITIGNLHDHNKDYAITYVHAFLTITQATTNNVTASIEGWTYGETPKTPSATGKFGANTATFTYSKTADGEYTGTVPTEAGTWYVKATVAGTDNYVGAVSAPVQFTIEKKEVGLEWGDTEFTYNGTAQKPEATATGLEEGDECTVTVDGEQTDANAKTDTKKYVATATDLSNENYKLPENVTCDFTIAPKELTQSMISLDSDTIKHDGSEKGPEVTMTDEDIPVEEAHKQMVKDEDYTLSGDVRSSELGTHVITAEGKGNYTGSIETSWMMYSKKSNEQKEEGTGGRGDFEVFGDIESNTSDITVSNFTIDLAKGFLTEEDMARYMEGEDVLVYMIIKEQPKSETGAGDRYILDQLFRETGATDISWYDITVWKKIGNSPATRVHDTGKEILMSVEVPDGQKNAPEGYTREFYMGRSHDGASKLLAQTSEVKVGFGSSKFSTYALAYKDTEKPKDDPGKGGKKGKGGANTGDPNDIAGLLALMLASGGALGAIGCRRRRSGGGR